MLYSTELALPRVIPSIVINYLTKNVLAESTQWVKLLAEKRALTENRPNISPSPVTPPSAGAVNEKNHSEILNTCDQKLYKFPRFGFIARPKKWMTPSSSDATGANAVKR